MVFLRRLLLLAMGLALAFGLTFGLSIPAYAQGSWGRMATISATMGVSGGRLCVGEASRGDIGCPTYTPTVDSAGLLTTGNISSTGNISANAFYGDGSGLTGINASGIAGLQADRISSTNNQSLVLATEGGTVSFTLGGTPGAAYLHPSLGLVINSISTTALSRFTDISASGNISADVGIFNTLYGTLQTAAQPNITSVGSLSSLSVTGDSVQAAISATNISASGNISANAFYGDGSGLTGINASGIAGLQADRISSTNNQSLVLATEGGTVSFTLGGTPGAAYLHPSLGLVINSISTTALSRFTDISASGNISANMFIGDGSLLTNLPSVAPDWYSLTNIPAQVVAVSNSTEITMQRISSTYVSASLVQLSVANDGCSAATLGSLRRDPTTGSLQFCR